MRPRPSFIYLTLAVLLVSLGLAAWLLSSAAGFPSSILLAPEPLTVRAPGAAGASIGFPSSSATSVAQPTAGLFFEFAPLKRAFVEDFRRKNGGFWDMWSF